MNYLKFWGVRGSIPSPGPETVRYGGNTACIELRLADQLIILDAGSGLRNLGNALHTEKKPIKISFFFSHTHWDHIQGLPFFMPAYNPENEMHFYGTGNLRTILSGQMRPHYFPLKLDDIRAKLAFHSLDMGPTKIAGINLDTIRVNHPGVALGFRFKNPFVDVVYISDNEPPKTNLDSDPLVEFIKDCDILIHDAQYTPEEYPQHLGWGHSPYTYPIDLAVAAGVKQVVLFHHDPQHNDQTMDTILVQAVKYGQTHSRKLKVLAATEGLSIPF